MGVRHRPADDRTLIADFAPLRHVMNPSCSSWSLVADGIRPAARRRGLPATGHQRPAEPCPANFEL
jgi:hypothetical protein